MCVLFLLNIPMTFRLMGRMLFPSVYFRPLAQRGTENGLPKPQLCPGRWLCSNGIRITRLSRT